MLVGLESESVRRTRGWLRTVGPVATVATPNRNSEECAETRLDQWLLLLKSVRTTHRDNHHVEDGEEMTTLEEAEADGGMEEVDGEEEIRGEDRDGEAAAEDGEAVDGEAVVGERGRSALRTPRFQCRHLIQTSNMYLLFDEMIMIIIIKNLFIFRCYVWRVQLTEELYRNWREERKQK